MKRDLDATLDAWKADLRRKPLLLGGARQTGKSHLLREFGRRGYEHTHVFDFEQDPGLAGFFQRDLRPERIIRDLALHGGSPIRAGLDLIVFDEIQVSERALTSLKYFHEQAPEYHVAAAGSLLGIALSRPGSFPVGKVDLRTLHPMTFPEFLQACGKGGHREYLDSLDRIAPLPDPFHEDLLDLLRQYYVVGGMPEAVSAHAESSDVRIVREVQGQILNAYALDFANHASGAGLPRMRQIWESLPVQLARENRRFFFSAAREGARARDYEDALLWLEGAGLVHRSFAVETPRLPLRAYSNRQLFKVYVVDVGLLGALSRLDPSVLLLGDAAFREYHGAFVESYVAQELRATLGTDLYYWRNRRTTAEVDFLFEMGPTIVPLEAKAGINPRGKSLRTLGASMGLSRLLRTTARNLRLDGIVLNIPLYSVFLLPEIVAGRLATTGPDPSS